MRKLFLIACAALIVVAALYIGRSELQSRLTRRITLPFKIALLYTKDPDREILVPVEGVNVKQIANTWHAPRSNGRQHQGQDIFAEQGTRVYSATAGYVAGIGENSLGGNTVTVIGDGGRSYYYAHFDSYAPDLAVGDYVTPETVLGYVGTTGNARGTPPHLHFGVYAFNGAINPLLLLRDRAKESKPGPRGSRPAGEKRPTLKAFNESSRISFLS